MASLLENSNLNTSESSASALPVFVFDRRKAGGKEIKLPRNETPDFASFRKRVIQLLEIPDGAEFVLTNTARHLIKDNDAWGHVEAGDSVYVLDDADQQLSAQTLERVNYLPHYDTIVKGGMYEYYASEGQNPLPYALAELIDNALAATAENFGPRHIEIRLHLGDDDKNTIFVIDNGKGMTSRQLNNWAIYRLSKFIRKDSVVRQTANKEDRPGDGDGVDDEPAVPAFLKEAPRSLNSDISYFGVGGKQAIFFMGSSTRMVSKPRGFQDVHELTISKEAFEEKEKNKEDIYSGIIRNRKPGDTSHLSADDEILKGVVREEEGKESFTVVCINGITTTHVPYLKANIKEWTRQLAHIYHYYIHGPNGNVGSPQGTANSNYFQNIDIMVKLFVRGKPGVCINLKDIDDDMQTKYLRTATTAFEFKAIVEGTGIVEGVIRYHPFLYHKETFPLDENAPKVEAEPEEEEEDQVSRLRARGKRPIFECYWNGRLIPYSTIDEFQWCAVPKKSKNIPVECYNRISGVLWTNDKFQVSTNKLTFIDLEMRLRDKNTAYCRVIGKNEKRTEIGREFTSWLKECHELCDKQIKFTRFLSTTTRKDLPKNRQGPWAMFEQIEWDGKVYKKGDMVRIARTQPILYGSINKFYLFGEYSGDVYATGGELEVAQEPVSLYNDTRLVPLSKLDRTAPDALIQKYLEEEDAKLPNKLLVTWPEGEPVKNGEKRPAGKTVGDIKVEISNKKGELVSKLPGSVSRKLLVELKVIWHSPNGDEVLVNHISQHGKSWPYWFRKMENIKNLGAHTLHLQAIVNESSSKTFAGHDLPSLQIKFTVTEAAAERFSVGLLEGPFRIGIPFQIPLEFHDEFGNLTKPNVKLEPKLDASGLEIKYGSTTIKQNILTITDVVAIGSIPTSIGKSFNLTVTIEDLPEKSQSMKIRLLPGPPHTLKATPEGVVEIENGGSLSYNVEIVDQARNPTAQHKLGVLCKFITGNDLPVATIDLSRTGQGTITCEPVLLKRIKGTQLITAKLDVTGVKNITSLEREVRVKPSSRAATMTLCYEEEGEQIPVKSGSELSYTAGEVIKGLTFTVFDEAGEVKEIDDALASKMKANWTPKLPKDLVKKGALSDIKVPTSVSDNKYCQVSLSDGSGLEFTFTVKPMPGEPASIKCTCVGSNKIRLGEKLESDIHVGVLDKHSNKVMKFEKGVLMELSLSGEGLVVKETIRMLGKDSGFNVEGIRFEGGILGPRELCVKWRTLVDYVRLEVVPGQPSKLALVGWDLSQPSVVCNGGKLAKPMQLQLCDEQGNLTPEAGVRLQLAKDFGIKVTTANDHPGKTNEHGKYNFGTITVHGKKGHYEIQPKAFWGRVIISGPKVKVHIQPDAKKPVSLEVEHSTLKEYIVGEKFEDFSVKVMAEDETPMTTSKASNLKMKVSLSSASQPSRDISYPPDGSTKKDEAPEVFTFSNRAIPRVSGTYTITFVYIDDKSEISSKPVTVEVQPGPPEKLASIENPGTPTVSNTHNTSTRYLIRNLTLQLRDKYNNAAGQSVNGKMKVDILKDTAKGEVPCMVGNTRSIGVNFNQGTAIIQNVMIEENTPGRDGQEYTLRCSLETKDIPKTQSIAPFDVPFLFYNDVKKQSQMAALSRERDNLQMAIQTYKSLFDTTQQLINELKKSVTEAQTEEKRLRDLIKKAGVGIGQLQTAKQVESLINSKHGEKEAIMKRPRRVCGLPETATDKEVLGKITHLALIEDDEIARVLSWHMSADMDCVVTLTTAKAKQIFNQSSGKQQVLPLDSIYRRNLPDWSKPLPHTRINKSWKPAGNPVYARNLMVFRKDIDNCKIVFGMLLGDTIILDDLDSANAYRQEIVKHNHCPTILTREGDRIRSNGKFGGLMNKALPIDRLRGLVFGQPLPKEHANVCSQIELLQSLKKTILKRQDAEIELNDHLSGQNTPEMKAKHRECQEAEEQLANVEQKLGVTAKRAGVAAKREASSEREESAPSQPRFETPAAKQPRRTSVTTPVNGSNGTPAAPTRQSLRRSAIDSPPYAQLAGKVKRPRRT